LRKYLLIAPLLVFPWFLYHLIAFTGAETASRFDAAIFRMPMISGGVWEFTLGGPAF